MKKEILLLGGLLFALTLSGQDFSRKYFAKTEWFSYNKDSLFYTADTLKLIKHANPAPEWASESSIQKEYAEFEMTYLNTGDFVEVGFDSYKKMHLSWRQNNYMTISPAAQWTWTFDKKTEVISFYDAYKKLAFAFRPISEKQVKIKSRFAEHQKLLTTIELTVVRVK